jgi:hypothetical protein
MPPPEVWGPAVWNLFHTLIEHVNENIYTKIYIQFVFFIQQICKFLPCPECSFDATRYLTKVNLTNNKTKLELKNSLYIFHNYVNAKKRKPLFNYGNINIYKKYKLVQVVNNFITNYNTKGNMKLLTESFQRSLVLKNFKNWLVANIKAFIPLIEIPKDIKIDTQVEVENTQVEVDNTQVELDNTQVELDNTQVELDNTQVELDNTQVEVENTQVEVDNTQVEVENTELVVETN